MISAEKIVENWGKLLEYVNTLSSPRKEKLLKFYNKYDERLSMMPASGKTSYHNAFSGGYVDHVLRVINISFKLKKVWQDCGAVINFTDEELLFVAMNHDLGKFGNFENEEYLEQDSDWHKNRGEIYKHNPAISFMKIPDRSLYLLQNLGIEITENEYLGIKLHDGMYEESNKSYFFAFSDEYKLRSNLPYIVHHADMAACRIESNSVLEAVSSLETVPPKKSRPLVEAKTKNNRKKYTEAYTKADPPPVPPTPVRMSALNKFLSK